MCLDKRARFKTTREGRYGVGYKIFIVKRDSLDRVNLRFLFMSCNRPPTEKWINEKDFRNQFHKSPSIAYGSRFCSSYKCGFHIFVERPSSVNQYGNLKIVKVLFRKIVAKGKQGGENVVVAEEIFIPKDQDVFKDI